MNSSEWKPALKRLVEASYLTTLQGIPETFDGMPRKQVKVYRRMLKKMRRHAALDVGLGIAVIVANAAAVAVMMSRVASATALATSASGGLILFHRGAHALIDASPRGR
jgi:hypothetical protein